MNNGKVSLETFCVCQEEGLVSLPRNNMYKHGQIEGHLDTLWMDQLDCSSSLQAISVSAISLFKASGLTV